MLFVLHAVSKDEAEAQKSYTLEAESVEDAVCVAALIFDQGVNMTRFDPPTGRFVEPVRIERLPRSWYLYDDFGLSFWALDCPGIAAGQVFGFRTRDPDKIKNAAASFLPGTIEDREHVLSLLDTLPRADFAVEAAKFLALRGALEDRVFAAAVAFPGGYRRLLERVERSPSDGIQTLSSLMSKVVH